MFRLRPKLFPSIPLVLFYVYKHNSFLRFSNIWGTSILSPFFMDSSTTKNTYFLPSFLNNGFWPISRSTPPDRFAEKAGFITLGITNGIGLLPLLYNVKLLRSLVFTTLSCLSISRSLIARPAILPKGHKLFEPRALP